MKYLKSKWMVVTALVIAVGIFAAFDFGRTPAPQYFTSSVERGDIHDVVEATGTINAVTTVQVGSQVSGTIAKLSADFNSHVTRNQVIAEIDPSLFRGALLQAQADLEDARANLAAAKAALVRRRPRPSRLPPTTRVTRRWPKKASSASSSSISPRPMPTPRRPA